ncbi:hypothetical protein IWW57_001375 [Coemansia sp. S610]|nr:hypothetical protein IWW57_001375 [Coemansia sp. S610]
MLRSTDEIVEREMGPKPKRLKDSYDLYVLENTQRRQRENPGLSIADAKSGLASRWNRLSKEMRQPYFDRFEEMVKKYDVDIAAYYERARALLISAYGESSSPSDVLERMLACQIKQPVPAHYLYFLDVYEDIKGNNPGLGYYDARKVAAAQWKTASKEARQAYKDRFNASMEQYKIDSAAYEARERNILKTAIRKLRQPCESSTANTAQPAQYPPTDVLTSPVLPPLSQRPVSPVPVGPLSRTSVPSLPTSSVPPESSGLLPSPPAPIESIGSLWPAGSSASSLAALPSGAASSDVAAPAHPLAISWPAAIPFSDDCPASPPHSVNSGGLSGPSALAEETLPSIPATTPDLVAVAAANAAAALVTSQEQSLGSIPPAPDATTPAPVLPIESAEPSTPSKKKSKKKKRKHAADYDSLEPDEGHRKKKNKKKRMSNVVVKIESGVGEATTNTENGQAGYAGIVVKTET